MFHLQAAGWMTSRNDPGEERNQEHLIALREARAATDYHASVADEARRAAVMPRRLALTTGLGSNVDLAACCA